MFRPPGGLQGEVVDWIQLPNWPVFNVADIAVVSAAFVVSYLSWKNVPFSKNRDNS
jgi:signal peptidase II